VTRSSPQDATVRHRIPRHALAVNAPCQDGAANTDSQDVETAGNICAVKETLSDNTILISSFSFRRVPGLDAELTADLLASIESGRLVIVCGAGLSMAPPSSLPSAKAVAQAAFDEYVVAIDPAADRTLRDDLEELAQHFVNLGTLKTVFIERLVPWSQFVRPPNPGHAAVADFLITRATASSSSANYDGLIERQAWDYGADFVSSLDGDEATARSVIHSPLLKFNGCSIRDRRETVWSKSQLGDPVIASRIAKSRTWMAARCIERDRSSSRGWYRFRSQPAFLRQQGGGDHRSRTIGKACRNGQRGSTKEPNPATTRRRHGGGHSD
jgi:hypothetical protein